MASSLGSDVPACLASYPVWVEGKGEILHRVANIAPFELVLVNPNTPLATQAVFETLNFRTGLGATSPPKDDIVTVWDLVGYLADCGNDLETPACALAPAIDEVLEAIAHEPGCVLAQMSGSGATCFGIFQEAVWADGAADRISQEHKGWWVKRSRIAGPEIGASREA
jgi:4-diphosphocytidyl-2-C-methyl-D-erythritol kinase